MIFPAAIQINAQSTDVRQRHEIALCSRVLRSEEAGMKAGDRMSIVTISVAMVETTRSEW